MPDTELPAESLWQHYCRDIEHREFTKDPAQQQAIITLDNISRQLLLDRQRKQAFLEKLKNRFVQQPPGINGLYLWGGVGRGKTYVMDLFYDFLPSGVAYRTHFHRFMQSIHRQLVPLKQQQDPLQIIAENIAKKTQVLCFDEFFVSDIGDAMILSGLLSALFNRRLILVTTSNSQPDDLYRDGLHRERFLPAIGKIKKHTQVMKIDNGTDYRLKFLDKADIYHVPLEPAAEKNLQHCFEAIAPEPGIKNCDIELFGRKINCRRCTDDVAWFEFKPLCSGPRSNIDYIELARCYHTVLISNIPIFDENADNTARRFIDLVDVFYDRRVNLIVSAAAQPDMLYRGKRLAQAFRRAASRLTEMQSHEYLGLAHQP